MYGQMFLGSKFGALSIIRWTVRLGPGKARHRSKRDGVNVGYFQLLYSERGVL